MIRTSIVVLVGAVLAGCGVTGTVGPLSELERNERLWAQTRPVAYVFALERLCFCGPDTRGPARLRVDGVTVTERVYVDTGEPVPQGLWTSFPDVDGLFEEVRAAIEDGAFRVDVTYDPALGVPTEVFIDRIEMAIDDEVTLRVTEAVQPD